MQWSYVGSSSFTHGVHGDTYLLVVSLVVASKRGLSCCLDPFGAVENLAVTSVPYKTGLFGFPNGVLYANL